MSRPIALALLAVALAGPATGADRELGPADVGPRTVSYTYEARVTPPAGAREVELWLPLPREENQAVATLIPRARAAAVSRSS